MNSQETVRKQTGTISVFCSLRKIEQYRTALADVKKHEGGNSPFPVKTSLKPR